MVPDFIHSHLSKKTEGFRRDTQDLFVSLLHPFALGAVD